MKKAKSLKQIRIDLDQTQEEFGASLGLSQSHYSAIESGRRPLNVDLIRKVKEQFGVELQYPTQNSNNLLHPKSSNGTDTLSEENAPSDVHPNAPPLQGAQKTKSNQDGRRLIFERKLKQYLKDNPDIQQLENAVIEVRDFDFFLDVLNQKYFDSLLKIADTEASTFEEVKELYWKNIEQLRPYRQAFINLAGALKAFYREMNEAGDKDFDWAEKE